MAAVTEQRSEADEPAVSLRGLAKVYDRGVAALGPIDLKSARGNSFPCSVLPAAESRPRCA